LHNFYLLKFFIGEKKKLAKSLFLEDEQLKELNRVVKDVLQISPLKKRSLRTSLAVEAKCRQIGAKAVAVAVGEEAVEKAMNTATRNYLESGVHVNLLKKFEETTIPCEKIKLLTVPASAGLTVAEIAKEYDCSKYLAKKAIETFHEFGIFSKPVYKTEICEKSELDLRVREFYLSDLISRQLPGRKDYVSVKENGTRVHKQKRLLLVNLKTAHELFLEENSDAKIGLTKFSQLRPVEVVFAGSQGTLTQCVCQIHENCELMFEALKKLLRENLPFKDCTDVLWPSMCNPPNDICHLGECLECPGLDAQMELLDDILKDVECVRFSQWLNEGRCHLEVLEYDKKDFIELFTQNLYALQPHRFLVQMQHAKFETMKSSLAAGEVMVLLDYAENYTFVLQNAVQSAYWNQHQATLHVAVCLYRDENELKQINYVVVSDNLDHDTKSVHLYLKLMMPKLIERLPFEPQKFYYFSDGCGAQYKNRFNFSNLSHHEADFGVPAEWHFHPTSHGKNLCDGIGGTVKRLAYRASLQKDRDGTDQIDSAEKLYDFVTAAMPSVICELVPESEHAKHNRTLTARFSKAKAVQGCRSMHAFYPVTTEWLATKRYSLSNSSTFFKV
jgi:hypothetical protein